MSLHKILNFLLWPITGRMNADSNDTGVPMQDRQRHRESRSGIGTSSSRRRSHTHAESGSISIDKRERRIRFLENELEKAKRISDGYRNDFNVSQDQYEELKRDFDAARETIQAQTHDITELTETIALSTHGASTTTRDDDYFEAEFAGLAGAIHQWVFRSFRGKISDLKHQDLPKVIQDSLDATILGFGELEDSKTSLKEIEAAVAEMIRRFVFTQKLVLASRDVRYDKQFDSIFSILGRSDIEKRKWHAQTVDMIFENGDKAEGHLTENTTEMGDEFQKNLDIVEGNEEQRRRSLRAIIDKAAKLQLETFRQISFFQFHRIKPGAPYNPKIMDDRSGTVANSEELEGSGGFIVHMVLFPPVLRWGFDDEGNFLKKPVIVRKGTVHAIAPES